VREPPRRRRPDDDLGRGGLPLFPLVLVVILAGLLLGGALAHFFGPKGTPRRLATSLAAIPSPLPTPARLYTARPALKPLPTRSAASTARPSATPSATATSKPTVTPKPSPAPARAAKLIATASASPLPTASHSRSAAPVAAAPPTPQPVASAAVVTHAVAHVKPAPTPPTAAIAPEGDQASTVVRSYLNALARGDRTTAATYLARGVPTETFMSNGSHIESIRSASIGHEQYQVTADVQTNSGEYYITFTVQQGPGGAQIADHYWIKPQ
jgi:hypothetical protein